MTDPQNQPGQAEPTQEEMAAMLADRLARTPVRDVLLQCMATFIDMAGVRLGMGPTGNDARDLAQARQAIEALRALLGVAERELGPAQVRPFKEPLAVLQMAFSRASEERAGQPAEAPSPEPDPPPPANDAASRLWVPPGTPRGGE